MASKFNDMVTELPLKVWVYSEPNGGFSIQAPRLATCFASGDTLPQALHNFKFAVFDYYDVPMAKQNPNLISYKFTELPEPDHETEQELGEVDIDIKQLMGAARA